MTDNFVRFVALDAFGTGIPTDYLALRIHHKDRVVLDSVEEHPISFFTLSERLFRKSASTLRLRQMRFRILPNADVADHPCTA